MKKGCSGCKLCLKDLEKTKQFEKLMDDILSSKGQMTFDDVIARAKAILNPKNKK
jgi:hypothetical protein